MTLRHSAADSLKATGVICLQVLRVLCSFVQNDKCEEFGRFDMSKILIVTSDFSFSSLLEARLLMEDHQVSIAGDGILGLQMAKDLKPNVIVLDAAIPKMSGYKLVEILKAPGEALRDIPVIVVTDRAIMGHMFRITDVFHFSSKPVNPVQFLKQVEAAARYVPHSADSSEGEFSQIPMAPSRVLLAGVQRYIINKMKHFFEEKGSVAEAAWDESEVVPLALQMKPDFIFLQFGQSISEFNSSKIMSELMQKNAIQASHVFSFCPTHQVREAEFLLSPARAIGFVESRDLLLEIEERLRKAARHGKTPSA